MRKKAAVSCSRLEKVNREKTLGKWKDDSQREISQQWSSVWEGE